VPQKHFSGSVNIAVCGNSRLRLIRICALIVVDGEPREAVMPLHSTTG
jgi:hypothetical protein